MSLTPAAIDRPGFRIESQDAAREPRAAEVDAAGSARARSPTVPPTPPTARQSFSAAVHLATALGCNVIPCSVEERRPLVKWAPLHSPRSARISRETLLAWGSVAEQREREGVPTAWALLPGSGRYAVIDCDRAGTLDELLERFGRTPLIVRSPVAGHAHLWYRWPHGADIGGVAEGATRLGYGVKARGNMIHAPHSLHRSGVGWYTSDLPPAEWTAGLGERLPIFDLEALDADRIGRLDLDGLAGLPEDWAGEDEAARRGIAWLRAAGAPVPGERESKTWRAAMSLGDLGVPEAMAARLIVAWDAEGQQPRGAIEVLDTVTRAYARRRLPGGCRRVADSGEVDADAIFADLTGGSA